MKNFLFGDFIYDQNAARQEWTIKKLNPLSNPKEIIFPDHVLINPVVAIGNNAFSNNQTLESITIPDTIIAIHDSAFRDCSALRELVIQPSNKCLSIDMNAFEDCCSLRHVYFHRPVKLYTKSFCSCRNLQIVEGNIQYVGRHAFSSCQNLTSIWFKTEVEIAESAFAFCREISTIKFSRNIIGDFSFMEYIPKTTKILCQENNKLLDLSYLGYNVQPYYEV